ncbi:MAG: hypothetical protein SVX43_08230 [Cyanobacteriota bacterium]|nr:hypothetical protein [Cyanobacteriota bacterium]
MQLEDGSPYLSESFTYYPKLAKVLGGATAAIFWSYLDERQGDAMSEWVALTVKDIEARTGLSAREQELARKQLRDRGFLQERLASSSNSTLEFFLDRASFQKKLELFGMLVFSARPRKQADSPNATVEESESPSEPKERDPFFPAPRSFVQTRIIPNYRFEGPWESDEQFEAFQSTLFDYAIAQGFQYPGGWVFNQIDRLSKGLKSLYWEEFLQQRPLGSTQKPKRDWEVEPGVPYPAFEEERIQYYIHKGEPLEAAVARARFDLRNPTIGQDLWEGFLRRCDRLADEALKAKKLGVTSPYLPPSFTPKPLATKEEVARKLAAVTTQPALESSEISRAKSDSSTANKADGSGQLPPPPLSVLQTLYDSPLSRILAERQIAEHPEWGYAIVEGCVVDLFPF